jgi:hypothetical protein
MVERRKPRGRFGGTGGWHPQVRVTIPTEWAEAAGEELEVDELLAPLLVELWRRGVTTTGSCQNAALIGDDYSEEESGEAHIRFSSVEWAQTFAEFVGEEEAIIHRDYEMVDTDEMVGPVALRKVEQLPADTRPDWPTQRLCVAFPADWIDERTQALQEQREREFA